MDRKIQIAFLIDTINSVGGTEKQLLDLIALLPEDRFEKHLVSLRPPNACFRPGDGGIGFHQISIPSLLSMQCIAGVRELVRFLKDRRIDIVQTYFVDAQLVGIIAGRLAGIKKIVCCRRDMGFWHSRGLLLLLRLADRFVDHFQVNSKAVGRQVINDELVDPGRVHIIYNGIDSTMFDGCTRPDSGQGGIPGGRGNLSVGILANINRRVKRVDLFVRAAAEVSRTVPGVRFFIAGDGKLKGELEALCRELGIDDRVTFLGTVTDIPGTIRNWDVGVISSESEGFCNAILEYMASGIPVAATAVGGNPELVEDGVSGFLVPSGDYRALAERLCVLLRDAGLRRAMGEQGRRIISLKYDWPKVIRNYESFYRDILGYDHESCLDHMGEPEKKPGDQQGTRYTAV